MVDLIRYCEVKLHGLEYRVTSVNSQLDLTNRNIQVSDNPGIFMLCSEEDRGFIMEMPEQMIQEVFTQVGVDIADEFVLRMDNNADPPRNGDFRTTLFVRNLLGHFKGSLSFSDVRYRSFQGDLWYRASFLLDESRMYDRIFESLQKHLNAALTRYKKAKLSVRMLDALSKTANFRQPQDIVVSEGRTRQEKQKQARLQEIADATASNDRATSALTVFQSHYLNPQLRDVGVVIPRFTEVNPRNVLALARQAPFVRARFQGGFRNGWWFLK